MNGGGEQGRTGMDEQQSPSRPDAGTTEQETAITSRGGTPGAERLGIRPSSGGVVGDPRAPASDDATVPGGLSGGMDGDMTGTGVQADASQEGANVQP